MGQEATALLTVLFLMAQPGVRHLTSFLPYQSEAASPDKPEK